MITQRTHKKVIGVEIITRSPRDLTDLLPTPLLVNRLSPLRIGPGCQRCAFFQSPTKQMIMKEAADAGPLSLPAHLDLRQHESSLTIFSREVVPSLRTQICPPARITRPQRITERETDQLSCPPASKHQIKARTINSTLQPAPERHQLAIGAVHAVRVGIHLADLIGDRPDTGRIRVLECDVHPRRLNRAPPCRKPYRVTLRFLVR